VIPHWLNALGWLILVVALLAPLLGRRLLDLRRAGSIERLGRARGSRAIALIARRETYRLLGFPLLTRDTIDSPEGVLRQIARTPPRTPIDLVLHAGPGHALAAEQIAHALVRHPARVTVFVPHHATGGALLIALAAEELVLDPNAVLGPVAPRVGPYPANAILTAAREKGPTNIADETLILADEAQRALAQVRGLIAELLVARTPDREGVAEVAALLTGVDWTPDYPILLEEAQRLGLPVSDALPPEVHAIMDLYDTATERRPSTDRVRIGD
jgi:ClpP class serine protease